MNTILTSEDREEGLAAFFERRPPGVAGAMTLRRR